MKNKVSRCIIHNLIASMNGKKNVSKILKEQHGYDKEDIRFIVFPEHDEEYFYYGTLYLDEYMLRESASLALILYCDERLPEFLSQNVRTDYRTYMISSSDMDEIIDLNRLISLDSLMKIISLDLPFYRNGRNLLGYNNITIEQMIGIGIYRLLPFTRIDN